MSEQMCVCGIPNNVDNCERCRLIAELTAAQQRVAELEAALQGNIQFNAQLLDGQREKIDALTADNARLRELLREWIKVTCDYANLELVVVDSGLIERSKAAIGEGE